MKKSIMLLIALSVSWNAGAFDANQTQIHGFVSQGYLQSDHYDSFLGQTHEGTFQFSEFGFNISSQPLDRLRLGIQVLARNLGDDANKGLAVDWAMGDYRYRNWLGVRAGKMKRPEGLYNQIWDVDAARSNVLPPASIYDETMREAKVSTLGLELYGTLPGSLEYQMQYGTISIQPEGSVVGIIDRAVQVETQQVEVGKTLNLHLEWLTPFEGLKVGGTYAPNIPWTQTTNVGDMDLDVRQFVLSAEYTSQTIACAAEYGQKKVKLALDAYAFDWDFTGEYYYAQVSYRVVDWLEVGTYYSVSYPDIDDKDGEDYEANGQPAALAWHKDLAISTRFDINEYWLVKLEGHRINGLLNVTDFGDNPSEEWFLFAGKVTYSF